MLKRIIKRDGVSVEDFVASKLNKWGIWASRKLGDRVEWPSVVQEAVVAVPQKDGIAKSQDLQETLIDICLRRKDYPHNLMAGRLLAAKTRKELYDECIPTIRSLHQKLFKLGLMKRFSYSPDDYRVIESFIDHERDFELTHFQIDYSAFKYGLKNVKTGEIYESTQFIHMRLAMHLAEEETDKKKRLVVVQDLYEELSNNRINPPTPALNNLGTLDTGLASCCLYTVADSIPSLHAGDTIAYLMTAASAGIGGTIQCRSIGDQIRNGKMIHKGKLPYLTAVAGAVKANTQGSRGGAIAQFVPIFDPEIESILMLQNPRTPTDKQNRNVFISVQSNKFLTRKALKRQKIFLFNPYTAPDLFEAFFAKDESLFPELYKKYEENVLFEKVYIDGYKLLVMAQTQSLEVGTLYASFMDEINRHTPHLDTIRCSNLCSEITQPTHAYETAADLYKDHDPGFIELLIEKTSENFTATEKLTFEYTEPVYFCDEKHLFRNRPVLRQVGIAEVGGIYRNDEHGEFKVKEILKKKISPEVSLCSLAAVVQQNVTEEQYPKTAYYALYIIDRCIDIATYPLAHIKFTSMMRRNAGVGLSGVAYSLAKKGLKYSTIEGRNELHRIAETHAYWVIKAALQLGKEKGNAPWMHKTLWPQGWLPIDTYKRTVDEIVSVGNERDWEPLREEIIANGGIRFSSLIAHMPLESSSKQSGGPNSVYPIRALSLSKADGGSVIDWATTDSDLLAQDYEIAYDIHETDLIKCYAVVQKFTDQAISADLYKDRRGSKLMYSEKRLVEEYANMVKYGMKTRYYQNILTSESGEPAPEDDGGCGGGACKM